MKNKLYELLDDRKSCGHVSAMNVSRILRFSSTDVEIKSTYCNECKNNYKKFGRKAHKVIHALFGK